MEGHYVPRYIDSPVQVLMFEIDDLAPFGLMYGLGVILEQPLAGIIIGVVMVFALLKIKVLKPRGYLKHLLYQLGVYDMFNKKLVSQTPKAWQSKFIY